MHVAVIVLNWNGKSDTLACLESLGDTPHLIVVDNGSTDGSVEEIRRRFPRVTVLETGKNLGYAGGNNVGIEYALKCGADAVVLLNNDTVVEPGFVEGFVHFAKRGILGGYPLRMAERDKLDHLGGVWNEERGDFDLVGLNEARGFKTEKQLDYVCGCSIFIPREVFEKIGLLEPKFFLFWEEADFAMRAKRAGFSVDVCYDAVLYHKVSASFTGSPQKKYYWWRGRFLFIERNCSPDMKQKLFRKYLYPEAWHYRKLLWIKSAELLVLKLLRRATKEKAEKLEQYRAVLRGIRDYTSIKDCGW